MYLPYFEDELEGLDTSNVDERYAHKIHKVTCRFGNKKVRVFYKKNKKGQVALSINEVAFSELARALMPSNLSTRHYLVKDRDSDSITGLLNNDVSVSIDQRDPKESTRFLEIDPITYQFNPVEVSKTSEIPYVFLDKLPNGYFAKLMALRKSQAIKIDMESLASVLVGKYILEEDDLHKGNIGLYVVEKIEDGKVIPHVKFFTIDHDLMLANSVTSFIHFRLPNLAYTDSSFNITPEDLTGFPDLRDSLNHYWPTRSRWWVIPWDSKIYTNSDEMEAFKNLKMDPEFIQAKWKRLLKGIMMPEELIQASLSLHLNKKDPSELAKIQLINLAMKERLMQLRANLLSIPEFRSYIHSNAGGADMAALIKEYEEYIDDALGHFDLGSETAEVDRQKLIEGVRELSTQCASCCNPEHPLSVKAGDTPLHIAIRLGQYRFEQSEKAYSKYWNATNGENKTPIEMAIDIAKNYEAHSNREDPSLDPFAVIQDLLNRGAEKTPELEQILEQKNIQIEAYRFHSKYYDLPVTNYRDLKKIITELGGDSKLSLKTKKNIALELAKQHMSKLSVEDCAAFRADLNGTDDKPIAPEFLFISQLRSNLWIIRWIRGLYGSSSTRCELNTMLEEQQLQLEGGSCFSFLDSSFSFNR